MRKKMLLGSVLFAMLLLVGCEKEEEIVIEIEKPTITEAPKQQALNQQAADLNGCRFHSAQEVEEMSDEDLIVIAQNEYKTSDFFEEGEFTQVDLFGVELKEECNEYVQVYFFWTKDFEGQLDVTSPIPQAEFEKLIEDNIQTMYGYVNTKKPEEDTGSIVVDEEAFFCGENNGYVEYSVRYTERRSMYSNDVLKITDIPRAYRKVYLKNYVLETNIGELKGYLLGELNAEYVKAQLDVLHYGNKQVIYREIEENDNEYIYTYYYTEMTWGDYGVNDTARLMRQTQIVDKETQAVLTEAAIQVREVEIAGTEGEELRVW